MGAKVLLVDDSVAARIQLRRALEGAGLSIVEAYDGVDACEKLTDSTDISVIVCDLNMPRMNGLEFLEQLRAMGKAAIPVLILTTDSQRELMQRARALGVKGWILKPFQPEALVATVKKLSAQADPTVPKQ